MSLDLPKVLSSQSFGKLISYLLIERRLLLRISEKSFKFFEQYKRENENFKTQSEMTMILLNDLLDFA